MQMSQPFTLTRSYSLHAQGRSKISVKFTKKILIETTQLYKENSPVRAEVV